jgi:hypothetical protein
MEDSYRFRVTYDKHFVCYITARTGFEAIDKVYNRNIDQHPDLVRKLFNAKKSK